MRVLVLGATGMLGSALLQVIGRDARYEVTGAARKASAARLPILTGVDVLNADDLTRAFDTVRPQAVINAVGLVKQLDSAKDPLQAIPINGLLPHRLARLCALMGARLVHVSTDCVFKGDRGGYVEDDPCDAVDLYGLSKALGEVTAVPHAITLRTSIIGRELGSRNGLVEWFLNAGSKVDGYRRVIFSGLPTVVLGQIICDHVLPSPHLHGLYHVGADPIDKFSLLTELRRAYRVPADIQPQETPTLDRSLNSERFRATTGWSPEPWPVLVNRMAAEQP